MLELSLSQIAQSMFDLLPEIAKAFNNRPDLEARLTALFPSLLLPVSVLQPMNALQPLLDALGSPQDPNCELRMLPHLLQSYIGSVRHFCHDLYYRPSSSRLPYDVFMADKICSSVRIALTQVIKWLSRLEAIVAPDIIPSIWACRHSIWDVIAKWGGYLETDAAWGELVENQASQAKTALDSSRGKAIREERLIGWVLRLLTTLETLDHAKARIGESVLTGCILVRRWSRRSMATR